MKLQIAIPAYNEEASIESIIQRCLDARPHILSNSPVSEVEITVVSDGSTDRTVPLARRHESEVRLIVFEKNRGYGAAIKEGWNGSDADLLGFLDADGTCDPRFFADLCETLVRHHADVVLGSRLNAESRMPLIRRVGNTLYACLLSLFAHRIVRDTASGMRVVRRRSLARLLPLPDGLHFTPAMTARALMSDGVKLVEIDMPYNERDGESKLRVGRDGLRFLKSILDMVFLYRPWRPLSAAAVLSLAVAILLMLTPTGYYLEHRAVEDWMIYRFIVAHLAGTAAALLLSAGYITGRTARIALDETHRGPAASLLSRPGFWIFPAVLIAFGTALVIPSFLERMRTGHTNEHWSRFIAMSFCFSTALVLLATRAVDYVLGLLERQLIYLRAVAPERGAEAESPEWRSAVTGPAANSSLFS